MLHAIYHDAWLFDHLVEVGKHFAKDLPVPGFSDGH